MAGTAELRQTLFDEIVARIEETDLSVPVRKGPWLYYGRTVEGSSYGIHCRRPSPGPGADTGPSTDDRCRARSRVSRSFWTRTSWPRGTSTSPWATWRSAPTTAGWRTRPTPPAGSATPCGSPTWPRPTPTVPPVEAIDDTSYGVAWANDNATVFYVRVDEAMRPYQLWRHRVGTDPAGDALVYEEPDDHFYLGVGRTKDDRFILLGLDSKVTSEYRALPADDPRDAFAVIEPRRQGVEYSVDHDRGDPAEGRASRFLIVTNDGAEDFRLMEAPDDAPGRDHWTRGDPRAPGRAAGRRRPLRRPPGGLRARGRRDPDAGDRRRHRRLHPGGPARVALHGVGRGQPRVRLRPPSATSTPRWSRPARSSTSTWPRDRVTLRKRQPVLGDFDPGPLPDRAPVGHGPRRHRGAHVAGLPARPACARARTG